MKRALIALALALWSAAALGQATNNPPLNSGGTITFPSGGSLTLSEPSQSASATFRFPDATNGGAFSQQELLLQNFAAGNNNVIALQAASNGFSALTARSSDNIEHMAIGYANASSGYIAANSPYWEWSSYDGGNKDRTSFTGSITTTTLSVTAVSSGTLVSGQLIFGSGVTNPTTITGSCSGSTPPFTCPVSPSQSVGSEAMTSGLPVPKAWFIRSGFYPTTGTYRSQAAAYVENYLGTDGRWVWPTIDAGTSIAAFLIDPTNDFVTINNQLLLGNLNITVSPLAALDNYGHIISGGNTSQRNTQCTGFVLCSQEATTSQLRMVNAGIVKTSLLVSGTSNSSADRRIDFVDNDNSSIIPLSISLNGGGTVQALNEQIGLTASSTLLALNNGELGFAKITAGASAPGASGAKLAVRCGTNAGSAKIVAYAGTSSTGVTVLDNIGSGVTGC